MPKIDDILNDPDFLALPEEEQNTFIDELRQKDFGKVQNTKSFIERAIATSVGGPLMGGAGANKAEDIAVPATQIISNFIPGANILGRTGLTTLAEVGRQGVKSIRGEGFNPTQVGKTAAITGAVETTGSGLGKLFFGKAPQRMALSEKQNLLSGLKSKLAEIGDNDTGLHIPKEQILNPLKEMLEKIKVPFGGSSSVLKRWTNFLNKPEVTHISPRTLMEFEDDLTEVAKFAKQEGGNIIQQQIKKRSANKAAKGLRKIVSAKVDESAYKAGIPEFESLSKEVSGLMKQTSKKSSFFEPIRSIGEIAGGSVIGAAFGNPIVGASLGVADILRRNPTVQDALFKGISKTGIGSVAKTGISEIIRRQS